MIITDLNYLEVVQNEVTGGYNFGPSSSTYIKEDLDIDKYLRSVVHVYGNFAGAEAHAGALGYNTSTQAISSTNTVQGYGSVSDATSTSASDGHYFTHW